MTQEEAHYVFEHYRDMLPVKEIAAFKHYSHSIKIANDINREQKERLMLKTGWITTDHSVLYLLKDGYEQFVGNCAEKLLREYPDKIFFNRCPKCNSLARTPLAKQCRHCFHSWH